MNNMLKFLKYIFLFSLIISILCSFGIVYVLWKYTPDLPDYDKITNYQPNLTSRLYSSDGLLLKSFYKEERIYIPFNRMPKEVVNAFISAEDKKFFKHYGIDLLAILRAFISNISNYGSSKRTIGASTITQQVVKNLLLTNELSYERKIKEIILAIRVENVLSKNKILELYLNDIYLGFGSYGIGSASLNYFNKSIDELELHEIAFLAALPKAPNNYNPKYNYDEAIIRRNWVIDRMYQNGYIQFDDLVYKSFPINIYVRKDNLFLDANYYFEETRKKLLNQYKINNLYSEGLIIKSSLNSELQKKANSSLVRGLINYDKKQGWRGVIENTTFTNFVENIEKFNKINPFPQNWKPVFINQVDNKTIIANDKSNKQYIIKLNDDNNYWLQKQKFFKGDVIFQETIKNINIIRQMPKVNGAIVVLNPHNGDILALAGGFSYNISQFNRATQAKRQPGSAFKPFVYIAALKDGYSPSTLILDAPYVVDQGPDLPKWKPSNYTDEFYGLSTMRIGIEKSRNLMTIRLADRIGVDKILSVAKVFGIDKYLNNQLSMALGSGLVTLIDITNSYGMIANGGKKINPNFIKSIYNKEGSQIYRSENKKCLACKLDKMPNNYKVPDIETKINKIFDSKTLYQITSMMEGVIKRGTGKNLKNLEIPIAGKTGTTNKNKDAWFIGFTPNYVIGVYVGYDKPQSLGFKQTGSSVALPIFKNFIESAKINANKRPFLIPSGISFVKINQKTGEPSNNEDSILEPFIVGKEPFNMSIDKLNSLGTIENKSISGTGALLN